MTTELNASQGTVEQSKQALVKDLRAVVSDADELLTAVGSSVAGEFFGARTRFETKLADARSRLDEARIAVAERARLAADATHEYVSENPWRVLGLSAALGVIVGILLSRR